MRLVVDGYGKFLGKRDNQLVIKENGHEEDYFLAEDISQVMITGKGAVSFDALKLLAQNKVDVVVLGWTGDIIYRLSPPELKNAQARREQFLAYEDQRSGFICKEFIRAKMENQKAVLGLLAKSRTDKGEDLRKIRDHISELVLKLQNIDNRPIDDIRGQIFGLEGQSSILYWKGFEQVISANFNFDHRSGRGAPDGVNALLNYGYGILRGEVWRAIHISSLDPYAGFLHADRWGRPSLVFDLMEEFRQQVVDRSVLRLINKKKISPSDFRLEDGVCLISDRARKKLIAQVLDRLDTAVKYSDKKYKFSTIIANQSRLMVKFLTGKEAYRGFYLRW